MANWLGVERQLGKKIVHGRNYGMKKRLLSQITGLDEKMAEEKRQLYFSECPGILHWHHHIQTVLKDVTDMIEMFADNTSSHV